MRKYCTFSDRDLTYSWITLPLYQKLPRLNVVWISQGKELSKVNVTAPFRVNSVIAELGEFLRTMKVGLSYTSKKKIIVDSVIHTEVLII